MSETDDIARLNARLDALEIGAKPTAQPVQAQPAPPPVDIAQTVAQTVAQTLQAMGWTPNASAPQPAPQPAAPTATPPPTPAVSHPAPAGTPTTDQSSVFAMTGDMLKAYLRSRGVVGDPYSRTDPAVLKARRELRLRAEREGEHVQVVAPNGRGRR